MSTNRNIVILGGGLAGLSAAIHLSKEGEDVTVIEKSGYPRHKVCGEYISNEIVPYLEWLGVDIAGQHPAVIKNFEFSTLNGKTIHSKLPLGGIGISRYAIDYLLYKKAIGYGCKVVQATVTDVAFTDDIFTVKTADETFTAGVVLGAYGKRSNIDQKLSRLFFRKKSPWLAVKAHYKGEFPDDVVALHNFEGGYCGVSKTEEGTINVCYLADFKTFKKYKDIEEYQREVLCKNPHLKTVFERSTMRFEKPLTISQVSFDRKKPVENHILMTGDTAGLIHPLCGNGMAMAIHSAKIASELVLDYNSGKITNRAMLEKRYTKEWQKHFGRRMFTGRILSRILQNGFITGKLLNVAAGFPSVMPALIRQTHGKPVTV